MTWSTPPPLPSSWTRKTSDEVIGAFQRCCTGTIIGAGGHVARYLGDGVLAFFGYPQAQEDAVERAEAAGDRGPWRQQAILVRGRWEADALRDLVRDYTVESLADQDAVLVIDG